MVDAHETILNFISASCVCVSVFNVYNNMKISTIEHLQFRDIVLKKRKVLTHITIKEHIGIYVNVYYIMYCMYTII